MDLARITAAQGLMKMERDAGYSNLVLDELLRTQKLDSRQAAFASALFYGVLERKYTLQAVLQGYLRRPIARLAPAARQALYLGVYQMLYLDSVPDAAAVDESVKLVKYFKQIHAAGLVNAVLRAFLRDGKPLPAATGAAETDWAVQYSCPQWLVKLWRQAYGDDCTKQLLANSLGRPATYLRVNTLRTDDASLLQALADGGIACQLEPIPPHCIAVEKFSAITAHPAFQSGAFHIQDRASQICAAVLQPQPGQRVADFCAAPGGKSFTMAQLMENTGSLYSFDLHPHRVALIAQGAKRLGITNLTAQVHDGCQYNPQLGFFDRILCDVPCSGLGVIRRKPEIKYKDPDSFADLPQLQYRILTASARYLKPGGRLVYSTCTLNPAENQQVVTRFLQEHPQFAGCRLPDFLATDSFEKTFFGREYDTDGFYLALLERIG